MKNIFLSFLFLFVCVTTVFAGDPIPGIGVAAGKNPGGQGIVTTKTDNGGRFSINLKGGSYNLTIAYADIQAVLKSMGKNATEVTVAIDAGGNSHALANDRALPAKFAITQKSGAITITVPASGATISGTLTGTMAAMQQKPSKR